MTSLSLAKMMKNIHVGEIVPIVENMWINDVNDGNEEELETEWEDAWQKWKTFAIFFPGKLENFF